MADEAAVTDTSNRQEKRALFDGHHACEYVAVLGAIKAASLRSAAPFRGASGLDRACAQR